MPRFLQRFVLASCLLLAARSNFAFSLLGEVEAWQVPAIGHNEPGDIAGVKNITEEHRWNVPVITYGFDNAFLSYFGSHGVAAIDAAFAILNSLPPYSEIDTNLSEFPLLDPETGTPTTFRDSRRENARARANGLVDLKSITLSFVLEQLGLGVPERWVWTLRDRRTDGGPPPTTNYTVFMRNFDPVTFTPTPYVNGTRYTYQILEDNQGNADAFEIPVDPESSFSSAANYAFFPGVYFTHLTRDDIGGLRYLYDPANLNWEPFPPNTQQFVPDRTNSIFISNQDLTLFSLLSRTVSPTALSNLYPGLLVTGATPTGTITNENSPIIVTNQVPLLFYTNRTQPIIVSTLDLNNFFTFTRTNDPAGVLAAFPDLVFLSTNAYPTQVVSIASIVVTNAPLAPWDDPFAFRLVFITNYVTNFVLNYSYTFANVRTQYVSPITVVQTETFGVQREPWSDALNPVYLTNINNRVVFEPSGGILIIPTNIFGYEPAGFPAFTNIIGITNITFQTNFVDPVTLLPRTVQESEIRFFTNVQYAVYPIEILPPGLFTNIVVTNGFGTNIAITYDIRVGNVITNYSAPTTPATRYVYTIVPNPLNPDLFITNVTTSPDIVRDPRGNPVPSGGFLIDTNLTGFEIVRVQSVSVIPITNVLSDVTSPAGERRREELVYFFTNTVYAAFPFVLQDPPPAVLRGGVDKITFVRVGDGTIQGNNFNYTNRYQVTYYDTNGVLVTSAFQNIQTRPDILFSAGDLGLSAGTIGVPVRLLRNSGFTNYVELDPTIDDPADKAGPGLVSAPIIIEFSKVGPTLFNSFPGFTTEASVLTPTSSFGTANVFLWGSFDGSTNPPIVFPRDITLEEIEARTAGTVIP